MRKIIGILVCVLVSSSVSGGLPQSAPANLCENETFYDAPMTEEEIYLELSRSVLRIEGHKNGRAVSGTGYLIDTDRGYILTALHVVRDEFGNRQLTARASSPGLPGITLTLEPREKLDPPLDVALLSVKDPTPLVANHIRAFDIALKRIPLSTRYYNIGYPRGKETQNKQTVTIQGDYEGRVDASHPEWNIPRSLLLDVKQDVDDGHSGSPLIDEDGVVVATCIDSLNGSVALYTPMDRVQQLFDKIRSNNRVSSLDAELKAISGNEDPRQSLLTQELEWRSGSPSNLELYAWAALMGKTPNDYVPRSAYFACPLGPAYEQRRLGPGKPVQFVKRLASPPIVARSLLNAGQRALYDGRPDLSVAFSQSALGLFSSLADPWGRSAASRQIGTANLSLRRYSDASIYLRQAIALQPESPDAAKTKVLLAAAYEGSGQKSLATRYVWEALPRLRDAGDGEGQAVGLETLGKVASSDGHYSTAEKDLRQALDLYSKNGNLTAAASVREQLNDVEARQSRTLWGRTTRFLSGGSSAFTYFTGIAAVGILAILREFLVVSVRPFQRRKN